MLPPADSLRMCCLVRGITLIDGRGAMVHSWLSGEFRQKILIQCHIVYNKYLTKTVRTEPENPWQEDSIHHL